MKKIIMVRKADGTEKVLCPKCGNVMILADGGYTQVFRRGEYDQIEFSDYWFCKNCHYAMDCGRKDDDR